MDAQQRYEQIVDELAAKTGEVQHAKMFGMPSIKAGGKAIGGFYEGAMVFKLPDQDARERALALDGAHLFEPMAGRPMKEWVVVPAGQADAWPGLLETALRLRAG